MATGMSDILAAAQNGFAEQQIEINSARARQLASVYSQVATGSADIDETFSLDRKFRLVFVRCHYSGTSGTAKLTISADSTSGSAYDTPLFSITLAGTSKDVNLRISGEDLLEPSPWTFQAGDSIRIQWTNPDTGNITWGLEVGLALAS